MFLLEVGNLKENFARYFRVEAAVNEALKHEVYRVRHAVYCQELGYEAVNADHEETDAFDEHSLHIALRAQSSDRIVGCVRLVQTLDEAPEDALPFEGLCENAIDRTIIDPRQIDRRHMVEISRLAVLSDYRKRKGDNAGPIAISEEDLGTRDQPRFPYIPVGLYLGLRSCGNSRRGASFHPHRSKAGPPPGCARLPHTSDRTGDRAPGQTGTVSHLPEGIDGAPAGIHATSV